MTEAKFNVKGLQIKPGKIYFFTLDHNPATIEPLISLDDAKKAVKELQQMGCTNVRIIDLLDENSIK